MCNAEGAAEKTQQRDSDDARGDRPAAPQLPKFSREYLRIFRELAFHLPISTFRRHEYGCRTEHMTATAVMYLQG